VFFLPTGVLASNPPPPPRRVDWSGLVLERCTREQCKHCQLAGHQGRHVTTLTLTNKYPLQTGQLTHTSNWRWGNIAGDYANDYHTSDYYSERSPQRVTTMNVVYYRMVNGYGYVPYTSNTSLTAGVTGQPAIGSGFGGLPGSGQGLGMLPGPQALMPTPATSPLVSSALATNPLANGATSLMPKWMLPNFSSTQIQYMVRYCVESLCLPIWITFYTMSDILTYKSIFTVIDL